MKREKMYWQYHVPMHCVLLTSDAVLNLKSVTVSIHSSDKIDGVLPTVSKLPLSMFSFVGQQYPITTSTEVYGHKLEGLSSDHVVQWRSGLWFRSLANNTPPTASHFDIPLQTVPEETLPHQIQCPPLPVMASFIMYSLQQFGPQGCHIRGSSPSLHKAEHSVHHTVITLLLYQQVMWQDIEIRLLRWHHSLRKLQQQQSMGTHIMFQPFMRTKNGCHFLSRPSTSR
ncbi:unnamed protein product [Merluccius merluccius]